MSGGINYYKQLPKGHPDRTYDYLMKICKILAKTQAVGANRVSVQRAIEIGTNAIKNNNNNRNAKGNIASVEQTGVVVPPPPEMNNALAAQQRTPNKAKFDQNDARAKGLCFGFQLGTCKKSAEECTFTHEKAAPAPKRPPSPHNKRPVTKPAKTPEERAKIPCSFHAKNMCRAGDKCEFSHAAPAQVEGLTR